MKQLWILVVVVLAGSPACNSDGKSAALATTSPDPTAAKPEPAPSPGQDAAVSDERCADPCRMLATLKISDHAAEVKKTWAAEWKPATADCDQPDFLGNCIYATAGYTFKKAEWRDTFGSEPWYKARPDFKDSDLSPV